MYFRSSWSSLWEARSAYQVPVNKPGQWANLFPCSFCQRSIYSFCGIVRCS